MAKIIFSLKFLQYRCLSTATKIFPFGYQDKNVDNSYCVTSDKVCFFQTFAILISIIQFPPSSVCENGIKQKAAYPEAYTLRYEGENTLVKDVFNKYKLAGLYLKQIEP